MSSSRKTLKVTTSNETTAAEDERNQPNILSPTKAMQQINKVLYQEIVCPRQHASPQLSQLPPEIFEIILSQVGGHGFICLRRTCKRIKLMVDEIEMRLAPCIWYRYTIADFSKACIESVMPWIKENGEGLEENSQHWKIVYSGLNSSMKCHKEFIHKKVQLPVGYKHVMDIRSAGSHLFTNNGHCLCCIGLKHKLKKDLLCPLTDLRFHKLDQYPEITSLEVHYSKYRDKIIYKPFSLVNQANHIVEACKTMVQSWSEKFSKSSSYEETIWFYSESAAVQSAIISLKEYSEDSISNRRWTLMQYDDKILIGAFGNKLIFCHLTSFGSRSVYLCSETELPHSIKSLHRLGMFLVVIVHDAFNNVFINEMFITDSKRVKVGNWAPLHLHGTNNQDVVEKVCDADIVGYALVLVTDLGNVFLTSIEDTIHGAIQKKLYKACEIERHQVSKDYLVCLDLNNGFVIAVLDGNQRITLLFAE